MKKYLVIIIAALLIFSPLIITGCSGGGSSEGSGAQSDTTETRQFVCGLATNQYEPVAGARISLLQGVKSTISIPLQEPCSTDHGGAFVAKPAVSPAGSFTVRAEAANGEVYYTGQHYKKRDDCPQSIPLFVMACFHARPNRQQARAEHYFSAVLRASKSTRRSCCPL